MTLIYLGSAWLAGILLGSLLHPPLEFLWLLTPLPVAVLLLWRQERQARLPAACALALLLGALRYDAAALPQRFDEGHIAHYNDRGWVAIRGVVVGEPDVRATYANLRLAAEELEVEGREREVRGLVLVRAPRYPEYRYGDELEVEGLLTTPPVFQDFSYKDYLARQGIYSLLRRPRITLLARGRGNPLRAALLAFKGRAQAIIARILPEPQASLLTGILLGVEGGIPADLMEDFNRTGTTHIIAISGFNISIIAGLLSGLSARLFGRRRATPFALAGIVLYTVLVGASAAVVRAAIMGCLYIIAAHYGRQTEALTSLVAAAVLMTAPNPHVLWDVGFQLSFAATLGLVLYTPSIESCFQRALARVLSPGTAEKIVGLLDEALIVTLAAQTAVLL